MTPGQIARLQELSKCSNFRRFDVLCIEDWLENTGVKMDKIQKAWLRRLTHQYRNQIAAIKRNQGVK
jgi:hypothetical protein